MDFGPLFLRDAPDVRKAGGNMSRRDEYEQETGIFVDISTSRVELLLTIVRQSAERSVINWMRTILLKTAISWKSVRRVLTDH